MSGKKVLQGLEEAVTMAATAMAAVDVIEEGLIEIEDERERTASGLTVMSLLLGMMAIKVARQYGRHPHEVIAQVAEKATKGIPDTRPPQPEPKVEDIPSRQPMKSGKSPWSY